MLCSLLRLKCPNTNTRIADKRLYLLRPWSIVATNSDTIIFSVARNLAQCLPEWRFQRHARLVSIANYGMLSHAGICALPATATVNNRCSCHYYLITTFAIHRT